jgi:hypothetical protein
MSAVLVLVSFWGFTQLTTTLEWLLATNHQYDAFRISLAALMTFYSLLPLRYRVRVAAVMKLVGVVMIPFGLSTLLLHYTYERAGLYFYPLETVLYFEAGVLSLLAGINDSMAPQTILGSDGENPRGRITQQHA